MWNRQKQYTVQKQYTTIYRTYRYYRTYYMYVHIMITLCTVRELVAGVVPKVAIGGIVRSNSSNESRWEREMLDDGRSDWTLCWYCSRRWWSKLFLQLIPRGACPLQTIGMSKSGNFCWIYHEECDSQSRSQTCRTPRWWKQIFLLLPRLYCRARGPSSQSPAIQCHSRKEFCECCIGRDAKNRNESDKYPSEYPVR